MKPRQCLGAELLGLRYAIPTDPVSKGALHEDLHNASQKQRWESLGLLGSQAASSPLPCLDGKDGTPSKSGKSDHGWKLT